MTDSLAGKIALVTGGGSGIGRTTALRFAAAGARIVVSDVVSENGRATVELIKAAGGSASFIKADVAQSRQVAALIDKIVATHGRLDCAFNNAGIAISGSTVECDEEDWNRTININLKGVWLCMKYEIQQMLKQNGGGTIVNTASVAGLIGAPDLAAYAASKGGVVQLTRTAALEYAKRGIRVNAVCPAYISTPMVDALIDGNPQTEARLIRAVPAGRIGQPMEVAEAVVWLCSAAASFVTGHMLTVDGGMTAM